MRTAPSPAIAFAWTIQNAKRSLHFVTSSSRQWQWVIRITTLRCLKRLTPDCYSIHPTTVVEDHPGLPVVRNYYEARQAIEEWLVDEG